MVEVEHYPFEITFAHLSVPHLDTRIGNQFRELARDFIDVLNLVVHEVDLPATANLSKDGFSYQRAIPFTYKSLDRQPAFGRCGDYRQVTHARDCQVQCAWNLRGRQCEDIDLCA